MDDDQFDVEVLRGEDVDDVTYSESAVGLPITITIPPVDDGALSANYSEDEDQVSSNGSLSIPTSVGSSPMITTRSLGSRSSFGDFPSNSNSISLSSDRELVNLACLSLRQTPSEVQVLDLSTNSRKPRRPLKSLKVLSELTNLVQLDLSGNAVERLDGLQVFTQLQTLAMPRNHLKTLSASLFSLKGLTHLDLSGNFIAHLPRAFSGLTMLEVLNLAGNSLGTLREVDVLAPLSNLISCNLAANPFCRLPTYKDYVVCKIHSLERLDEVDISQVARDRAAKRFSKAMFSQNERLREADRAHESEQNRLLEAQSALEAENLRLKGELQVKSKLLQNKSRAWSSATEQLLQLQQEVAMLNLDRRRSVSMPSDELSEPEQIAMAISARQKTSSSSQQRPQSAPRFPSPERSVEKRRGSFSDKQLSHSQESDGYEEFYEVRDAMPTEVLKRSSSKRLVDASCSPLRVIIPPVVIANVLPKHEEKNEEDEEEHEEDPEILSPPPTCKREDRAPLSRTASPVAASSRQQQTDPQEQIALLPQKLEALPTSLTFDLEDDDPLGMNDLNVRTNIFPTFEDDSACPAYEDTNSPALHKRSSSASALNNSGRKLSIEAVPVYSSGSHSLPPSPIHSPTKLREWYRKQNELRLRNPPPSPPKKSEYKTRRRQFEPSPLAPFVDKDVLARQIQALQSCKQSLLTEIRNEEHLLHLLKQESARYSDQIDCLSVNIQACLDEDPSAVRFSFSPPNSPRNKSKKLRDEETGRARLEILRNKLRFAEDKEKEIENTMVRMTKRVLHDDLNPVEGKETIRGKFSPVSSKTVDIPFDKEIFALTHKLQLVIVEKEEIHMQMSKLMAQLRGHTIEKINLEGDNDTEGKHAQSLAKSRKMIDELRTRHREVAERIELKERRIASLLEELKEVEAELKHISSLNESSALSPLFQRERSASLEFLQAMRPQLRNGVISEFHIGKIIGLTANTADETSSTSASENRTGSPTNGPANVGSEGESVPGILQFKELLNPEMLDEIKADIYNKLSQKMATSSGRLTAEISGNGGISDLHQAISAALETHFQLGTTRSEPMQDSDGYHQQHCVQNEENSSTSPVDVDTPLVDEVCCRHFDEFAPVATYYARKYVMAKDRVSDFVQSLNDGENTDSAQVASAQRILKICERLEVAETKSKFDPVSKIEVDKLGTSRGSLKITLQAARALPTAHLRTKNLDPYVCFEVVYPSHVLPPSLSTNSVVGKVFRSQTKKKSIYPVWDEDFEVTPILSLSGYLHVRVLNDRRLSREQLVGEARIPLHTLLHQKRTVEWFSLGLNVPPAPKSSGNVVSKLCGGAIRLQLQLYFSSVERYKHVVDELVGRYLNSYSELPPFIDAVGEFENRVESSPSPEKPEQNSTEKISITSNGTETMALVYDQRRQTDVEAHFPPNEPVPSLPAYVKRQNSPPRQSVSASFSSQNPSTQLSAERRKSLWEPKSSVVDDHPSAIDDKKPYFGFSSAAAERRKPPPTLMSMTNGQPRRSRTPTAQSKRVRNLAQPRRKSVETPECFDEYSPYHPSFKTADVLDGCNNEMGMMKTSFTSRNGDFNRKTDLSIFKSPSLTRRPPSSGFPERYIGLDNQTCERLKRIFGRMDGTAS
ncbi:Centriolin [Phytophthora citrophthora]|uniref:Centriolin n=1 Tax=Phytophthora citrophthora TaxID=4793 RepID=A0AAD9H0X9_9STRA|nr:Centriolin [Phytophthora citrophthora]